MAEAGVLDPNQWNVGVLPDSKGKLYPVNLLSIVWVGMSALDRRLFRKLDKSELTIDQERLDLLRALADAIKSWKLAPISIGTYGAALRRFVRWADEHNHVLSRSTIAPILASYCGDSADSIATIRRAAAQALDLTDAERELLFPPAVQPAATDDDWVIALETEGGRRKADFLRLLVSGNAALSPKAFVELRKALQIDAVTDRSDRAELMRALYDEFKARVTASSHTPGSLDLAFRYLRSFVVWADEQDLELDTESVIQALVSYSRHLTCQWTAGRLSPSSVHSNVKSIVHLLAGVLDRPPFEIAYRLSLPPLTSAGWTSARPDPAQLKQFCANLHEIVRALASEMLCDPIHSPVQVSLWSRTDASPHELPEPYGGYGEQAFDPRLANLPLSRLRIWAEMHRFIGVTGCNLSVTKALSVGDWRANGLQMVAIKGRANKFVAVGPVRRYEKHVAAHVEFLEAAWPMPVEDDTPLFPGIRFFPPTRSVADLVARLRAKTTAPRVSVFDPSREPGVYDWVKAHGLTLTSRQLRGAKAAWLFRRHSGDSFRVAQALGNTPQSAHDHYGGKGNLEHAIPEWARFWDSPECPVALAPGKCESPGRYEPVNDHDSSSALCHEGACLGCRHYRGEDSLDYIHRMLSYRHCLSFRAGSNPEVARQIGVIDKILDAYLEKNDHQCEAIRELQSHVIARPHPRFAAMIRLLETWRVG